MPKPKKARIANVHSGPRGGDAAAAATKKGKGNNKKMHTFPRLSTSNNNNNNNPNTNSNSNVNKNKQKQQQQQRKTIIPFGKGDRVLLIGEGDFSFAHSLVLQHRCRNVLATCYDSEDALYSKYPQAAEKNIQDICGAFSKKKWQNIDDLSGDDGHDHDEKEEEEKQEKDTSHAQASNQDQKQEQQQQQQQKKQQQHKRQGPKVLFSVDARKLGHLGGGGKDVRMGFTRQERRIPVWKQQRKNRNSTNANKANKEEGEGGPWDIICFNFPHVGGLSTDVNRQVRSNQELLVAFFKACVPLLSTPSPESLNDDGDEDEDYDWGNSSDEDSDEDDGEDGGRTKNKPRTEPGQILVTLFEGEPYTLWNIKDLARHARLRVVTSFKFPWASYEGYSHARTLGHIEGKHGGRGGWKGENREARMYVFERQEDDRGRKPQSSKPDSNSKRKKRSRNESESDDDSD